MAPEDSTGPSISNDGDNYFWYNWQPFSIPQPDMFIPSPADATSHGTSSSSTSNTCRNANGGGQNGWFLPFPPVAASPTGCSPHEDDSAATASTHSFLLHSAGDWHPFVYYGGEAVGDPPAEVPRLEDFLSERRASPPPPSCTAVEALVGSSLSATAGQCYYDEEQRAAGGEALGAKPGKSSSDEDSKSDNGNHLSQSGQSFDGAADISLTCAHPRAVVAFAPPGDISEDGKSSGTALLGTGQRSSSYRGVTRHRWTGRYEAHLWDNTCVREGMKRKGRQVYLGGYDREEKAARAYDLAALKYWGPTAATNFSASNYAQEIEEMKDVNRQEFIASLRRKSTGFSRGASVYRGVTRHHQHGRWQARIGRVAGNKDLYLGTFTTEEEAAEAYDIAAIKFRGVNAITNFELSRYNIEAIACTELPIGSSAKRLKLTPPAGHQEPRRDAPFPEEAPPDPAAAAALLHTILQTRSRSGGPPRPAAAQALWAPPVGSSYSDRAQIE